MGVSYRIMGVSSFEFRLLGAVEVVREGIAVPLGGRRQAALLALLLLWRGRPMTAEMLADELWDGQPPEGASTTLRSYVWRLRQVLPDPVMLSSGGSAYSLRVPPETVDALRFERLALEGREAHGRGAVRRAAERLSEALSLWRGHPLAGLTGHGVLRLEAERLEELRLVALEQRIEADLALGRSGELIEELETLVRDHPYRERLWHHLMLALYRSQRQADALAAYQRARTKLADELGLDPSEELTALEKAILRHEVPPFQPPEQRHNLPAPVTSFIGRKSELAEVDRLLAGARLLTLTGTGGVGKTRLALEVAARVLADCPDGVFFCDLAPLAESALVPRAVARVLGMREQPRMDAIRGLTARLRGADLLLLLDNCEHVRDACAELAQALLVSCPRLRILATSREPLGVAGEVDYQVPPLTLPAAAGASEADSSDAVLLLLARARAARPRLNTDASALTAAARICADLDGLPLAIELAAARAKALSLEEIAARLADRFRFLVSWRRLAPARHRTLREAMDWSFALLSEDERHLLARLSVFAGGFTLGAAAAVCLAADQERALQLVGRLVDTSLVVAEQHRGQTRYRLLETVRQYAAEHLESYGEIEEIRRRHAACMLSFAEESWPLQLTAFEQWGETMERERGNLQAALVWSRDAGEAELLLRLTKAIWRLWWISGDLSEGRGWLETALACSAGVDAVLRAEALEGAAGLAWAQGDMGPARVHAEAALGSFTADGDSRGQMAALTVLGHVALAREEFRTAESLFERSRRLAAEHGLSSDVAVSTHNLGSVAFAEGDLERAVGLYEAARSAYQAGADSYGVALSELYLGLAAAEAGRYDAAAGHLCRALPVFRRMRFLQYAVQCLEGAAGVMRARGEAQAAARLLGSASALRERLGEAPSAAARWRQRELAAAQAELGQEGFAAAWAEGMALAEPDAFDRAQAALAS
jgi:predicted ATPase/DNA-binding SARP family transcriptional activator